MELIIIISALYSITEGVREFIVYSIDREGGFQRRDLAVKRKGINAFLYVSLISTLILFKMPLGWTSAILLLNALFIRWFFLDITLNMLRELPLFYIGSVSTIDKLTRGKEWLIPIIKVLGIVVTTYTVF